MLFPVTNISAFIVFIYLYLVPDSERNLAGSHGSNIIKLRLVHTYVQTVNPRCININIKWISPL